MLRAVFTAALIASSATLAAAAGLDSTTTLRPPHPSAAVPT